MKGTAIYRSPVGALQLEYEDGEVVSLRKAEEDAAESEENALTALVFRQLDEYFAGTRRSFDFPCRAQGTPFQRKVWAALRDIPYGETRTYGDIARAIGQPKAARAVGMANNRNPIYIATPCHRVIGADGGIGGTYAVMPELYLAMNEHINKGEIEAARAIQYDADRIIYKMCEAHGNLYAVQKEILRRMYGLELGGVREPMPGLIPEDELIVAEAQAMIEAAIAKL